MTTNSRKPKSPPSDESVPQPRLTGQATQAQVAPPPSGSSRPISPFRLRDGAQHLGGLRVKSWRAVRRIIYQGRGE